jgi:signal recognition particle receptor subunit beta
MVQINFAKREVQCKVVYYGPAMSGKTKNLHQIHDRSPEKVRGALTTIATDTNRTLFFDFMPLNLGLVGNVRAKINLYAIPYIEAQNALRLLVLEGVDGIVFVADSAPNKMRANLAALENLHENVSQLGRELHDLPLVFQWNKRDLKEAIPVPELAQALNPHGKPAFEAAAQMGAGVFQTLKAITHAVLVDVTKMIVVSPTARAAEAPDVPELPPMAESPEFTAPVASSASPGAASRISAVATRKRTQAPVPDPAFEMPAPEPALAEPEPVRAPARAAAPTAAAASHLQFEDVKLPVGDEAEPREQEAHETPITPPWRQAPKGRPPVRSQQEEFADHLSTDSFAAHKTPRRAAAAAPAASAHATTDLPKRDVPRAADRHPGPRAPRARRTAETETALEPAGAQGGGSDWADYTDPKSVDLQGAAARGGWEQPQTGAVRVRGPVGGWDEARRVRDAHPVVDRRKRGRRDGNEALSNRSLAVGSTFSLFLLVVIGYLVHALL